MMEFVWGSAGYNTVSKGDDFILVLRDSRIPLRREGTWAVAKLNTRDYCATGRKTLHEVIREPICQ